MSDLSKRTQDVGPLADSGLALGAGLNHRQATVVSSVALLLGLWGSVAIGAVSQARDIPVVRMDDARVIINAPAEDVQGASAPQPAAAPSAVPQSPDASYTSPASRAQGASIGRSQRSESSRSDAARGRGSVLVETSQPSFHRTDPVRDQTAQARISAPNGQVVAESPLRSGTREIYRTEPQSYTGSEQQSGAEDKPIDSQDPLWELYNQVQILTEEVRNLRGMVESAQNDTQQLDKKQKQNYIDLDERVTALEQELGLVAPPSMPAPKAQEGADDSSARGGSSRDTTATTDDETNEAAADAAITSTKSSAQQSATVSSPRVKPASTRPSAPQPLKARLSEKEAYEKVYKRLQAKEFSAAKSGFEQFLAEYPAGQFAGSALYWLGELSLRQQEPDEQGALNYIERLIKEYPDHARIPDALYKQATLKYRQQEIEAARKIFEKILRDHPDTTAARLADHQLKRIDGSL